MSPPPVIINPPLGSDGNPSKWPERGFRPEDPKVYLSKLATRYAKDNAQYHDGTRYVLNALPAGYALFGKARNKDPQHIDRYLYGHPSGYAFRSQEEFYDHFRTLMQQGNTAGCTCLGCAGGRKKTRISLDASSTSNRPTPASGTKKRQVSSLPGPSGLANEHVKPTPNGEGCE